ncbi:collagen alpha-2(I) chain-like [Macrobrachium nipponense]|uniref:collagen alpha-2(I) chain-like n=1 Tax=Macrobrachium nipponense TaxID=159736 RepID=UPI0030C87D5A
MERVTLLLVLVGFLSPWGSLKVQGQPKFSLLTDGFDFDRILGEMKNSFKFPTALGSDTFPLDFADSFPKLPEFNFPPLFQSSPSLTKPPGSPWTFIPPQGGVSSTHAALVGPGSISGSSGPGGSFVTGTGNWYAVPGGKPGSSGAFFPPQGGVSSSQSVLMGPGSISGSSGPGGSFVTGTGNWYAVPGGKPGSSVAFFPPQGGVSSSQSVLVGPGSISGSSGPGGSFVTGTGNWHAVPGGKPGSSVAFFPPQGGVSSSQSVLMGPGSISGSSGPGGSFVTGTGDWSAVPGGKPGTSVFFAPQGGVSSTHAVLVGPGSISGSSGPGGSFVTGTGNWSAVPGSKPSSSVAFFPPQAGVSSSQSVLMGPGSISGSSGPGGSIVTGTGNWSAVPGGKPGTSVAFFPPQGGVSSTHAVLVGPGSISGSSGPGGSFVNGTGNWTAYPSKPGSTGVKNVTTTPGPDSIKSLKMVPDIALVPTVGIVPKSDDVFEPPSYPMDYQQMPSLEALYYHYFLNYLYNPWMHYNPYYGVYGM